MTNGFKGLDLVDRMPEELWTEILRGNDQNRPKEKKNAKRQSDYPRRLYK